MRNKSSIIWGICLILVAIVLLGTALNLWTINFFFAGWWTLLIIIPCVVGLFTDRHNKSGNIFGILIGAILLVAARDIINWSDIWKFIIPVILLIAGINLLFIKKPFGKEKKFVKEECIELTAIFSGKDATIRNETFKKGDLTAIFGGVELDLREMTIVDDIYINATCIFGGIDLKTPDNVNVVTNGLSVLGGTESKGDRKENEGNPTIYINTTVVFGGMDIG